tara:strand:+ start:6864 stop:7208 length:345 start_codon:yes stop_codon:yes gene_type:complete
MESHAVTAEDLNVLDPERVVQLAEMRHREWREARDAHRVKMRRARARVDAAFEEATTGRSSILARDRSAAPVEPCIEPDDTEARGRMARVKAATAARIGAALDALDLEAAEARA